jgi:trigger factor
LERRLRAQQREAVRGEILTKLLAETPFDLPADLVGRQEKSTIRRLVSSLQKEGLSDSDIRAREAQIRANAHESTLRGLKEFFLLAKVAEAEDIKVEDEDLEMEIEAIAARTDESPRRVRARIEKEGLADTLASEILERKALDRILDFVKFEEVPLVEQQAVETLDQNATAASAAEGGEAERPAEAPAPAPENEPEPHG